MFRVYWIIVKGCMRSCSLKFHALRLDSVLSGIFFIILDILESHIKKFSRKGTKGSRCARS